MATKELTKLELTRTELGLNKSELARMSGIQSGTIAWIETGRFKPYPVQLEKLAKALGWPSDPGELLETVSLSLNEGGNNV